MAKKAVALALSLIAIVFCVSNIDRRASADYNKDLNAADIEFKAPEIGNNSSSSDLKLLNSSAELDSLNEFTDNKKGAGLDFSLKRLIVQASNRTTLEKYATKITHLLGEHYILDFDTVDSTRQAFLELSDSDDVKAIEPDIRVKSAAAAAEQNAWGVENIGADHYKDWLGVAGQNTTVKIAVIDSGVNKNHDVFKNSNNINDRIVTTNNTLDYVNNDADPDDENGHGTSVAGAIAESTPSNVKIYPSKVFDASGRAEGEEGISKIFIAIANAVENDEVDIVNLSLGFDSQNESDIIKCSNYPEYEAFFNSIKTDFSTLVIAAAGNEKHAVSFPANCTSVIAVSSVKQDHTFSSDFSNFGPEINFAMPGEELQLPSIITANDTVTDPSITSNNAIRMVSGTSFAAPFLSAAAALIKTEHTDYTPDQIIASLKQYATPLGNARQFGNGIVDFGANLFYQPRVYAQAQATSWTKQDNIKIAAVSSRPLTAVAATLTNTTPTDDWNSDVIPNGLYTFPATDLPIDENGDYYFWFKNDAEQIGSTKATVSRIDNRTPVFGEQVTFSDTGIDKITVNASAKDAQSGLNKATLYYREKGNSNANFQTKTINYNNVTAQTALSFSLTGLTDSTEYEFYINAIDALGNSASSQVAQFSTQSTDPIALPDANTNGEEDLNPQARTASATLDTTSSSNPATIDPIIIYLSGLLGSAALGFAIYRTIGGRR